MDLEGISRAYRSSDFEFVAFVKAYMPCTIATLLPYQGADRDSNQNRGRYDFFIVGPNGEDISEELSKLSLAFINCQLIIEPMAFISMRKFLKGLLYDRKKFDAQRASRPRKNETKRKGDPHAK